MYIYILTWLTPPQYLKYEQRLVHAGQKLADEDDEWMRHKSAISNKLTKI